MFFKRINEIRDKVMSTEILVKAKIDKKILNECIEIAKDFEEKLSAYKPNSYISRINQMAGKEPVSCPELVINVIKEAIDVAKITNGKFDPTIGVLTQRTYGFGTGKEKIPSKEEIESVKKLVDYRNVEIFGNSVFLKKEGMALDLGGIGKGYASQLIAEYLQKRGADCGLVSIGGEICCYGRNWNIAIQHPRQSKPLAIITTKKEEITISTSGDYERYIKSYDNHHILNASNGRQSNYYTSLTLIKEGFHGGWLDAHATATFNTPDAIENAIKFGFDAISVEKKNGSIHISPYFFEKVDMVRFI